MFRLKECREKRGISQKALARTLGVNETTVIRWEKQRTTPNVKQIAQLCAALGVMPNDLISESA